MDYVGRDFYCIVEISLFPMSDTYAREVRAFIDTLAELDLDMTTTETATVLRGQYDTLMPAVMSAVRKHLKIDGKQAIVMKILNGG